MIALPPAALEAIRAFRNYPGDGMVLLEVSHEAFDSLDWATKKRVLTYIEENDRPTDPVQVDGVLLCPNAWAGTIGVGNLAPKDSEKRFNIVQYGRVVGYEMKHGRTIFETDHTHEITKILAK